MRPLTNRDAERLRRINNFTQLVAYLRNELQWPFVEFDDPDEIAFDWSAKELGIDGEHAAAIEEIRQLQPPDGDWPWGIFYVKFEKKRLPITILRRALASVVRKKRATANTGQRWDMEDLLFISSYGEGEKRQISFARFQAPEGIGSRLPVLKVLAWDEDDTDLSLEHTAGELRSKLVWPDDPADVEAWRAQWGSAFTRGHRETIHTSKELASKLAALAKRTRDRINQVLALENEEGPLRGLMEAFRSSLVHDLDEPGFADMYAQTIAYGLFSARVTDPEGGDAGSLLSVPVTNPFLKELLGTFLEVGGRDEGGPGIDFDELGVNDVVDLLDGTDMESVLRDFGDRNPMEDPVIHFFEGFLGEYDRKAKKEKGVFYTPRPVVSFIVRSVDELLRTEFGLEDGLADTTTWREMAGHIADLEIPEGATPNQAFVQILDPATGTGTFLVEAVDLIHKTMVAKWRAEGHDEKEIEALWNAYVPEHLLPRLHGYELMMAPYAIAHMKIGLKLHETGYRFESGERARVYLTNALEPAQSFSGTLAFAIPALAHEADAVNAIKQNQRFTVVIGNPPYSGISLNMSGHAQRMVSAYKRVDGRPLNERKLWLQDDYVKFLRLGQLAIDSAGVGVLGCVTNHSFLSNPTFRGMRQSLLRTFSSFRAVDLHGNSTRAECPPDGILDKNVFDIQQGVSVSLASKGAAGASVEHFDLWGLRADKYQWLLQHCIEEVDSYELSPDSPYYFLVPHDTAWREEYDAGWRLSDAMLFNSAGFITARDAFALDFERETLMERMRDFSNPKSSDEEIRARYFEGRGSSKYPDGDSRGWKVPLARRTVASDQEWRERIRGCSYRPFDERMVFWADYVIDWPRPELFGHMSISGNLALVVCRQNRSGPWGHAFVGRGLIENCYVSNRSSEAGYVYPLFLDCPPEELTFDGGRVGNFNSNFLSDLGAAVGLSRMDASCLEPRGVFNYIYAILHSPGYRRRYAEFLRIDFPRIPAPASSELLIRLSDLGSALVAAHLLDGIQRSDLPIEVLGAGGFEVEKVSYSEGVVWIDKGKRRGFRGVPEEVWNFRIGAYQVCEKWLKDRQAKGGKNPRSGLVLTDDDIGHYQRIVVALSETIRIQAEIDQVIEAHGGWPGAFVTDTGSEVEPGGASLAADVPAD